MWSHTFSPFGSAFSLYLHFLGSRAQIAQTLVLILLEKEFSMPSFALPEPDWRWRPTNALLCLQTWCPGSPKRKTQGVTSWTWGWYLFGGWELSEELFSGLVHSRSSSCFEALQSKALTVLAESELMLPPNQRFLREHFGKDCGI